MSLHQCPGPERKKPSVPEEVKCPECGKDIEMWSNENEITCPSCKKVISRNQL